MKHHTVLTHLFGVGNRRWQCTSTWVQPPIRWRWACSCRARLRRALGWSTWLRFRAAPSTRVRRPFLVDVVVVVNRDWNVFGFFRFGFVFSAARLSAVVHRCGRHLLLVQLLVRGDAGGAALGQPGLHHLHPHQRSIRFVAFFSILGRFGLAACQPMMGGGGGGGSLTRERKSSKLDEFLSGSRVALENCSLVSRWSIESWTDCAFWTDSLCRRCGQGFCGIGYSVCDSSVPDASKFLMSVETAGQTVVDVACTSDFIAIPCAKATQTSDGATCNFAICGGFFSAATSSTASATAYSESSYGFVTCRPATLFSPHFSFAGYRKPFEVRVYTDSADATTTEGIGFCLKYQQLPCLSASGWEILSETVRRGFFGSVSFCFLLSIVLLAIQRNWHLRYRWTVFCRWFCCCLLLLLLLSFAACVFVTPPSVSLIHFDQNDVSFFRLPRESFQFHRYSIITHRLWISRGPEISLLQLSILG